jgi:hypothetical protein
LGQFAQLAAFPGYDATIGPGQYAQFTLTFTTTGVDEHKADCWRLSMPPIALTCFASMDGGPGFQIRPLIFGDATVTLYETCPGDANGDGRVDINDLTIVLSNYGKTGMTWSQGEFTHTGTVDVNDLSIVLANFGWTKAAADVNAVPEPGILALTAAGLVVILCALARAIWRRRDQARSHTAGWS